MKLPIEELKHEPIDESVLKITDLDNTEYKVNLENRDSVIKYIEKIVRNSFEYKEIVSFIKEEMDMDHCFILFNVDMDTATIDLHHYPFTLYTITDIVARKQLTEDESCTVFTVAEEVMRLHYELIIGLIPLTRTVHELYHSGSIEIPVQLVSFNWKEFLTRYINYFTSEQKQDIENKMELSDKIINDLQYPILKRRYTYLHVDGMSFPKKIR